MRPIDDSLLTPDERRSEVASILAAGVLRLCARMLPATEVPSNSTAKNLAGSASSCLEVPDKTVLTVHNG
jgi:hypothetical protein